MKKIYIKPETDQVNVRLFGCLLQDQGTIGLGDYSERSDISLGKQNDFWEEDDFNGDIWGSGDTDDSGSPYDIWGE